MSAAHPRTDRHAAHLLHTQPAPWPDTLSPHDPALQPPRHPRRLPADRISLRHGLLLVAALGAGLLGSWLHPGHWF